MNPLWQDFRYGIRILIKSPGFLAIAVFTLALGIGANTALFSVLNTYLFHSLPYPRSDRLVQVYRTSPFSQSWPHSAANFLDLSTKNSVLEEMAALHWTQPTLIEKGEYAESLKGLEVSAGFFPTFGVQPELGRVFTPEEDRPGPNLVAVLSHRFWQHRFGGDPNILGRMLKLDGGSVKVIGVMPPQFEQPLLFGNVDVWRPIDFSAERRQNRHNNYLSAIGRLKPGVTVEQAQDSMVRLFAGIASANSSNQGESLRLQPLQRSMSDDLGRTVMWYSFGLSGFLLLIACANLANLQLVRLSARTREYGVRAALGAGRFRLVRQCLIENLIVATLGGGLSLLIAEWGVSFISLRLFSELPGAQIVLDYRVFGFAMLCSMVTGLMFGTVPAWLSTRLDLNQVLKENLRGAISVSHHRLRHALIIGEVALALILLAGGGLFLRGLQQFTQHDAGWQVDGLLTAQIGMPKDTSFYRQLEDRLRAIPGVKHVALSVSLPVWGFNSSGGGRADGQPEPRPGQWPEIFYEPVSPSYFETLGVRLIAGRTFNESDTANNVPVLIVNERLARLFWPHESAIGKRIMPQGDTNWWEIIGVVNDMRFPSHIEKSYTDLEAFLLLAQAPLHQVNIFLRTSVPPETLANQLRGAVAALDPNQPVQQIRTVRSWVDLGLGNITLLGALLGAFAVLGLVLAAVGIYGVISYAVAQRTNEIGIRMALGAPPGILLWLILSKGARLVLWGTALGYGGAYVVARLLMATIPTLPTRDPLALAGITFALFAVALLACYLPARRATKVDPMVALRYE
ncbi:MAG: ABC transporter permease [Acidobacteriia bacterium]|nr:ABC transporter permease [Terriglobia bacterium]